ncbi:MAG: RDD family protein [Actinomycetota bacterium]|nr:RDD family protein [Actinomycetota bacterium]
MGTEPPVQPPAQPTALVDSQGRPLAEWWKRLVAAIIDSFIIGIPANIIGGIIFGSLFAASTPHFNPQTGLIEGSNGGFVAGILASYGAFILMYWVLTAAYYIYLHGSKGQTVGKMVMKLKVVDETTGELIGYGPAFKRWILPIPVAFLTCGIGGILDGIWPLFDAKRQAWHDKFAKTLVIDLAA